MRVGVIRGDTPGPLFLADLEPTSQYNPPTEPAGQTRYVSRPNATTLTNFLAGVYADDAYGVADVGDAVNDQFTVPNPGTLPIQPGQPGYGGVPAGIQSSAAVTFPVVITGSNDTLKVANSSPPTYTTVTVASGSYATMAALLTAINLVLKPTGLATATTDSTGTLVVIQSTVPGVGSFIEISNGTINTPLNLTTSQTFTMPAATTIINALNPVVVPPATGSINVSAANLLTTLGASPAAASVANLIAPQFQETLVAIQSFQVGNLSQYLLPTWNPDPRHGTTVSPGFPANLPYPNGPAIQVVQNDGTTPFASDALAALPMITAAVHNTPNAGDITITGVGLGNVEFFNSTTIVVRAAASTVALGAQAGLGGVPFVRLQQGQIIKTKTGGTQGVVSATSIVIPASLLTTVSGQALGVAGSTVEVRYTTLANTNYGSAASVSAWAGNVSTLTGLTNQLSITPGDGYSITISGAASAGNNGTFEILSVVSATSVTIANIYGVAGDANNGALVWSEPAPVSFVVT